MEKREGIPKDPFKKLQNRLFELSNSFIHLGFDIEDVRNVTGTILDEILPANYDIHIQQIERITSEIYGLLNKIDSLVLNARGFWDLSEINYFRDKDEIADELSKELSFYLEELEIISGEIKKRQNDYDYKITIEPFLTDLTNKELAFLLKAMVECKIISIPEGKQKEFVTRAASLMASKGSRGRNSADKLYKHYITPDPEAIKELKIRFGLLKTYSQNLLDKK